MNLKVAVKYRLYDNKKGMLIFYTVILTIIASMFLFSSLMKGNAQIQGSIQGLEFASAIFLFVLGLNSFTEDFKMFMHNGISRKTMFISQVASTLVTCSIMALIDTVLSLISKSISVVTDGIYTAGMLEMMYGIRINIIGSFIISFLLCFFMYISLIAAGYLITTLYYRMNKTQKIIVSIGVPALLFVILPVVDTLLLKGVLFSGFAKITAASFINPFMCMLSCFIIFGIFTALSWLLVRKAVVKD